MFQKFFPVFFLVVMLGACADEELAPVITFSELEVGAFSKLISLDAGEYDLENLDGVSVQYSIEMVDGNDGSEVSNYSVYAAFNDRNPDNGDQSADEQLIRNLGPADFSPGPNGLPMATITIPVSEIEAAFGVDRNLILAGDRLEIRSTVTKGGTTWGVSNSSSAITNAFGGFFKYNAVFTCPLPDDFLVGDYTISVVGGENGTGFGPNFQDGETITFAPVEGASTQRTAGFTAFPGLGGFAQTMVIEVTCDRVETKTIDTGLACVAGSIVYSSAGPSPFDITDDSTFDIQYDLFSGGDGGCGLGAQEVTLRFTKS